MIPLFHDFTDKRVVVFGGGSVAARKTALFGTEAEVIVVSATFEDRFDTLSCQRIRLHITEPLVERLVADAILVIPATDDDGLNGRIESLARNHGCLVNSVDHRGETVTPSVIEGSNVSIAISTEGKSPAVSKYLRKRLQAEIERADEMADLQATIRNELADRAAEDRRNTLWEVLEDERVWGALEAGDKQRAETLAREHL